MFQDVSMFQDLFNMLCLPVVGDGEMSNNSNGVDVTTHKINTVYKSTVILACDLKPNTNPVWLQNELVLYSKVCTF